MKRKGVQLQNLSKGCGAGMNILSQLLSVRVAFGPEKSTCTLFFDRSAHENHPNFPGVP